MRDRYLRRWRPCLPRSQTGAAALAVVLLTALLSALLSGGCRAAPEPDEPAIASRAEVTVALYHQLQLVLERHDRLVNNIDTAAQAEREELVRLAAEIAVRLARVDPEADVDRLVDRMAALR